MSIAIGAALAAAAAALDGWTIIYLGVDVPAADIAAAALASSASAVAQSVVHTDEPECVIRELHALRTLLNPTVPVIVGGAAAIRTARNSFYMTDSTHRLVRTTHLAGDMARVFAFFKEPRNLETITPAWLGFRLTSTSDDVVRNDTRIGYRLGQNCRRPNRRCSLDDGDQLLADKHPLPEVGSIFRCEEGAYGLAFSVMHLQLHQRLTEVGITRDGSHRPRERTTRRVLVDASQFHRFRVDRRHVVVDDLLKRVVRMPFDVREHRVTRDVRVFATSGTAFTATGAARHAQHGGHGRRGDRHARGLGGLAIGRPIANALERRRRGACQVRTNRIAAGCRQRNGVPVAVRDERHRERVGVGNADFGGAGIAKRCGVLDELAPLLPARPQRSVHHPFALACSVGTHAPRHLRRLEEALAYRATLAGWRRSVFELARRATAQRADLHLVHGERSGADEAGRLAGNHERQWDQ